MSEVEGGNGLTDYIVKPNDVSWQINSQDSKNLLGFSYFMNNESLTVGADYSNYDYSAKFNYAAWGNDYIWLPSLTEIGYDDTNDGMWQLSADERKSYDGISNTASYGAGPGNNNVNYTNSYTYSWTRSANSTYANHSFIVYANGNSNSNNIVSNSGAVRPALHLNLSKAIINTAPNVTVDELWNNDDGVINEDNAMILAKYLTANSSFDMTILDSMASAGTSASTLSNQVLESGVQGDTAYASKEAGESIVVTLGGLEWYVTYLSKDENGDIIATLWLTNNYQSAFFDRSQTDGDKYGFLNGALYSDWSADWNDIVAGNYPSNMYGTSYIRAVTLNNGGEYATSVNNLSTYEKSINSIFADFTMTKAEGGSGLTDFLVTPNQVNWQINRQDTKGLIGLAYYMNGDSTTLGTDYPGYDYSSYYNYGIWGNDYLWLPSMTEVGYGDNADGLWELSVRERMNYDGVTTTVSSDVVIGSNNSSYPGANAYTWVRSARYGDYSDASIVYQTGVTYTFGNICRSGAVRPALHFNLSKALIHTAQNVTVDELWNEETGDIDKNNASILMKYLTGTENGSISLLDSMASVGTTANTLSKMTLASGEQNDVQYVSKETGESIVVTLGGLKWYVTYLSKDNNGDIIATLWLTNSTQELFKNYSQTAGEKYGFYKGGLYSDWSYDWYDSAIGSYPSNMYGTSYVRAVTLNNGGQYAINNSTLSNNYSKSLNSVFADFTMSKADGGSGLIEYLVTPNQVSWQAGRQDSKNLAGQSYYLNNESVNYGGDFNGYDYSTINRELYSKWGDDYLWLPSLTELGYNDTNTGLWEVGTEQRKNFDSSTTIVSSSTIVGSSNTNPNSNIYAYAWTRSGYRNNAYRVHHVYPSGNGNYGDQGILSLAVRPALHLNLSKIIYGTEPFSQFMGTDSLGQPVTYYVTTSEYSTDVIIDSVVMAGPKRASLVVPSTYVYNGVTYYIRSFGNGTQASDGVFYQSKDILTSIDLPSSFVGIGDYTFSGCTQLINIGVSNRIVRIGGHAFEGCVGLTQFEMPDSLVDIGEYAFNGCSSLAEMTIPNNVTNVGAYAFNGCSNLCNVYFFNEFQSNDDIGTYAFYANMASARYWFNTQTCLDIAISSYTQDNTRFSNGNLYLISGGIVINVIGGSGSGVYLPNDIVSIRPYTNSDARLIFSGWFSKDGDMLFDDAEWIFTATQNMDIFAGYEFAFASYDINHISQLFWLSTQVSNGVDFSDTIFNLTTDLYLTAVTDQVWHTIGDNLHIFNGVFNGNGYSIYYNAADNAVINGGIALHGNNVVLFSTSTTGVVINLGVNGDISLGVNDAGDAGNLYPSGEGKNNVWDDDILSMPR